MTKSILLCLLEGCHLDWGLRKASNPSSVIPQLDKGVVGLKEALFFPLTLNCLIRMKKPNSEDKF